MDRLFLPAYSLLDKKDRPVAWQPEDCHTSSPCHTHSYTLYCRLPSKSWDPRSNDERMPLIPRSLRAAGAACARALGGKTMKAILHCLYWTPRDARTPRGAAGSTRLQGTVGAAEDLSLDPEDLGEAEGVSDAPAPHLYPVPFHAGYLLG